MPQSEQYTLHETAAADSMGILPTAIGGLTASVVDAGTTIFNSLTPEKMNVSTVDLLSRISPNALQVYNEHPDAVQAASFLAGSLAPIGISAKIMGKLRSGEKGFSWFTEAGQATKLAEVEQKFSAGIETTDALKKAKTIYYAHRAANAVADTAAAEFAINIAMSSHPWMEDYRKDWGTNFLVNLGIGSAISAPIYMIAARSAITKTLAPAEKEYTSLMQKVQDIEVSKVEFNGLGLQARQNQVERIDGFLSDIKEGKLEVRKSTEEALAGTKRFYESKLVDDFFKMAPDDWEKTLPVEHRDFLISTINSISDAKVDKIKFFTPSEALSLKGEEVGISWFSKKFNKATGEEVDVANKVVYSPLFDTMVSKKAANDISTVADLGITMKEIEKKAGEYVFGRKIQSRHFGDAEIDIQIGNTAEIQKDYISSAVQFDSMTSKEFFGTMWTSTPGDLVTLQGINARLNRELAAGNVEQVNKFKMTLSYEAPSFNAVQKQVLVKAGVDPSYLKSLSDMGSVKVWEDKFSIWSPRQQNKIPTALSEAIYSWVRGYSKALRLGALSMQNAPLVGESAAIAAKGKTILQELKNLPQSVALREHFNSLADAEGYVYLYRGLRGEAKGHTGLESYTTHLSKASEFGTPKLYKVRVDDIVTGLTDIGGKAGISSEILVLNPTREVAGIAPKELSFITKQIPGESNIGNIEVTGNSIGKHIGETALRMADEMMADGRTLESIALRTGVPLETLKNGREAMRAGSGVTHFTDISKVEEALNPLNRAIEMQSNVQKQINLKNSLNRDMTQTLTSHVVEAYTKSSPSEFVRMIGGKLNSDEFKMQTSFTRTGLEDVLTTSLGTSLFRSADSVVERLGAVGVYITSIGREIIDIKNAAKKAFTEPLSNSLASIARNDLERIEFSNTLNIAAGLSGRKLYKAGKIWSIQDSKFSFESLSKLSDEEFLILAKATGKEGESSGISAATFAGKEFNVVGDNVKKALEELQGAGRHLYHLANTRRLSTGEEKLIDIGFWFPANNPVGKEVAYAFNTSTHETTMLMARTPEELLEQSGIYKKSLGEEGKNIEIVFKGTDQALYNKINGRHDPLYMGVADLTKRHGGASQLAQADTSNLFLADLIQGYDQYIDIGINKLAQLHLDPIVEHLEALSYLSQKGFSEGMTGKITQATSRKPVDGGQVVKNILLGKPNLSEFSGWEKAQSGVQILSDTLIRKTSSIISSFVGKTNVHPEEWKNLSQQMEDIGMANPYQKAIKAFDKEGNIIGEKWMADLDTGTRVFAMQSGLARESLTPRIVALGNALTATTMLRVMELAQPLVNLLSLPILTSAAVGRRLESSFAGAVLDPNAKFLVHEAMYDGVRLMNHPELGQFYKNLGNEKGLLDLEWRDVNGIMHHVRSLEKSGVSKIEEFLDGELVNKLSAPADWSEKMVRQTAFFTGMAMAKKAYPGISDSGAITFTRRFMDEAVGNYTAAQRPVAFQGTVGMAMGLFQTYMFTLGQAMFRGIEQKNYRMLGQMLLTQQGIFGTASLPGFHPISEAIGAHFSDNHYDLQTGTFRAIGDENATLLLYGLPSQLAGVNTRGDIQPRVPNPLNALNSIAAINVTKQALGAGERIAEAAFSADANTGKAVLEALSLQSLSRPVARVSELLMGRSITAKGNVMDSDTLHNAEGQIDTLGIFARAFATRPIEEIKAREADHLHNYYGAQDGDSRNKVTFALKSYIANNNLTPDVMENLAERYIRNGGTRTGWDSAVNTAIGQSNNPGSSRLEKVFGKDKPFNQMIQGLD